MSVETADQLIFGQLHNFETDVTHLISNMETSVKKTIHSTTLQ